jgi:hypothetical protein
MRLGGSFWACLVVVAACTEASVRDVNGSSKGGAGGQSEAGSGSSSVEGGAGAAGRGGDGGAVGVAGNGGHDSGSSHGGESAGGSTGESAGGGAGDGGTSGGGEGGKSGVEQGGTTAAGAGGLNDAGNGGAADSGTPPDCRRIVLARDYPFIQDLALDGGFIYWTTYGHCPLGSDERGAAGKVSRVALVGGPAAVLTGTLPCPNSLAVRDGGVFWANVPGLRGAIMTMPSPSGTIHRLDLTGRDPVTVVADADAIYWAELDGIDEDGIYRSSLALDSPPVLLAEVVYADWQSPHQVVLDDRFVYWTDQDYSPDPGLIQRVAKTGGIPEVLATAKKPRELAISSAGIFWIEEPSYNQVVIRMLDWSARALPTTLASAPAALALAARGDTVYWTSGTYDSGSIHRIRVGDSEPVTIVDGEPGIGAIALDEQYVYWATAASEGEIARTCR